MSTHNGFSPEAWTIYTEAVHSLERAQKQHLDVREALARIVNAWTGGVYCSHCGESVDDCDCIIGAGREALNRPTKDI
jgi:hypothetical protein